MTGWEHISEGRGAEYFYRPVEQNAGALIEALATLPPDTLIQTTAGHDGVDDLSYVVYYPATKTASLG
ncbi:hypothetical protein SEA_HIRKO_65 [Arthrobacter phage Hirko]|nr:hypothetical protein SEA_HIRKO_65 [Arthrobacter phage Hirko]